MIKRTITTEWTNAWHRSTFETLVVGVVDNGEVKRSVQRWDVVDTADEFQEPDRRESLEPLEELGGVWARLRNDVHLAARVHDGLVASLNEKESRQARRIVERFVAEAQSITASHRQYDTCSVCGTYEDVTLVERFEPICRDCDGGGS